MDDPKTLMEFMIPLQRGQTSSMREGSGISTPVQRSQTLFGRVSG
jgi:hypothetical protein